MKLDLKKFKKISDDKHSAVLRHADGHEIKIAKHVLSPENQKSLGSLPMHFDVGGQVPADISDDENKYLSDISKAQLNVEEPPAKIPGFGGPSGAPTFNPYDYALQSPDAPIDSKISAGMEKMDEVRQAEDIASKNASKQQEEFQKALEYNKFAAQHGFPLAKMPEMPKPVGVPVADASPDVGPAAPTPPPANAMANQPSTNIQGPETPVIGRGQIVKSNLNKPYETGMAGVQNQLSAVEGLGKVEQERQAAEANIYQANIDKRQAELDRGKAVLDQLHQEHQAFMEDYKNQHIDPNHYFSSMGTSQRMATAVGLVLGGFGGPGQSSMDRFVQAQLDNDMKAQEAEMNKKHNLISANYQQFGNIKQAEEMYQAQTKSILADQLLQQAAKSGSKSAMLNAQNAAGKLQWEASQHLQSLAFQQMQLEGMRGQMTGGGSQQNPELTIRTMVPEARQADAYKELGEAQDSIRFKDNVLSAFDQLAEKNTIGGAIMSPLQTSKQVEAIMNPILASLSKGTAGRFTEADAGFLKSIFPAKGDSAETIQIKKQKLNSLVSEKMNFPILKAYGINIGNAPRSARYDSSGEKTIKLGAPVASK